VGGGIPIRRSSVEIISSLLSGSAAYTTPTNTLSGAFTGPAPQPPLKSSNSY